MAIIEAGDREKVCVVSTYNDTHEDINFVVATRTDERKYGPDALCERGVPRPT